MAYDPKTRVQSCDVCHRHMNPTDSLTTMKNPDTRDAMGICPAHGCWETAHERGYFSRTELERQAGEQA
ncbi:hypothetical protein [Pseudonocardia dioxanivorans]|nr:hypothetical protein [Pseudonocardia dioxanivorans]